MEVLRIVQIVRRNRLTSIRLFPADYVTLFTTSYESNHYVSYDAICETTGDELQSPHINNSNNSNSQKVLTSGIISSDVDEVTSKKIGAVYAVYAVYESAGKNCIIL